MGELDGVASLLCRLLPKTRGTSNVVGRKVLGAVYEITEACLRKLDKWEGYPDVYKHLSVIVFTDSGEAIEAVTFIKSRQEEEGKASPEYLKVIQQGFRDWGII